MLLFTGKIAKGKWMLLREQGGFLQVGVKKESKRVEREKAEWRWLGGRQESTKSSSSSLQDSNTSVQHHAPFHSDFLGKSNICSLHNPVEIYVLIYVRNVQKATMCNSPPFTLFCSLSYFRHHGGRKREIVYSFADAESLQNTAVLCLV